MVDGVPLGDVTDDTNSTGKAVFNRGPLIDGQALGFCVSDIAMPGYTYDRGQNTTPLCDP